MNLFSYLMPTNQNGKQTAPNEILIKFHSKTKANKLFTSKTSSNK